VSWNGRCNSYRSRNRGWNDSKAFRLRRRLTHFNTFDFNRFHLNLLQFNGIQRVDALRIALHCHRGGAGLNQGQGRTIIRAGLDRPVFNWRGCRNWRRWPGFSAFVSMMFTVTSGLFRAPRRRFIAGFGRASPTSLITGFPATGLVSRTTAAALGSGPAFPVPGLGIPVVLGPGFCWESLRWLVNRGRC